MSIEFTCEACGKSFKVPSESAGKPAKCPCGVTLRVPEASAEPPAAKPMRDCPFCEEEIVATARKCKHCGEFLDPSLREWAEGEHRKVPETKEWWYLPKLPIGSSGCLVVLIIGLALLVVVAAIDTSVDQGHPKKDGPLPTAAPLPKTAAPGALIDQRNLLWWDLEKASGLIEKAIADRYDTKPDSTSDVDFVMNLDREFREPIAKRYGLSYEEAKAIYKEGETAAWRTSSPPAP